MNRPAEASALAHSNIAFVKYWGNLVGDLRLPYNDSLSMNLSAAHTTTTVSFDPALASDHLSIDGNAHIGPALARVSRQLDLVRERAGIQTRASVASANSFPMGTGIASSASAFAALTLAACAAAGLSPSERELSCLARRGSGSAARSIPGGFVTWRAAAEDAESYAETVAPAEHWDLRDIVAIVSRQHKQLGSTGGHDAATRSPFFAARIAHSPDDYQAIHQALMDRDMARFGPAVEREAIALHAIAMTGDPPALYWSPETLALLHQVRAWRDAGLPVWFTLDAGPNVHLLCEARHADQLETELRRLDMVETYLHNRAAGPARLIQPDAPAAS
ncbi:MAG: diphosphomevalonate decarboxylase [Caldilineae bacterium]|nr:diphosphomevalonate decarboxylase [Chloroflexota bacterium]MCB9176484.1 diphosphomevalonate decarboxylase [Caldilineae bacterium]